MKIIFLTISFLLFFSLGLFAQKVEYGLQFEGIADNREFFSGYSEPETILGSRIGFDMGTSIDSIHHIRAGLSYLYEFGTDFPGKELHPILYYSVDNGSWKFNMGAYPRNSVIHFPVAILSEKYGYYNPTVDGLFLGYKKPDWNASVFVDWVSRIDSVKREQFMAGISGVANPGNFIAEGYWYLFHNRPNLQRIEGEHIKDYMGALLLVGYNFSSIVPLDILTLKAGVLNSLYRDRGNGLAFEAINSAYIDFHADYKGFGVKSVLNFGSPHHFAFGDEFYNNTSRYIRTDLYFTPLNTEHVKGTFSWSFHVANSKVDNSQQFSLIYIFSSL